MAASYPAAELESSSLQTSVNPNIWTRVAQYQRKDPLEALAAVALEEEKQEEREEAVRPARALVM